MTWRDLNPFRPPPPPVKENRYEGLEEALTMVAVTLKSGLSTIVRTLERIERHMANIDTATENLEKLVTVGDGMATLLGALAEEVRNLKSAGTDPETAAKIDRLNQVMAENTEQWTAAVVANTDAEGEETQPAE